MPRLNLLIDTNIANELPPRFGAPRVERIACSWFKGTAFVAHSWTRNGQDLRRQLALLPLEIARLEKLVRQTSFVTPLAQAPKCHLVVVDATGQSRAGYPDPIESWIDWARAVRDRPGEDWRPARARPRAPSDSVSTDSALTRWSRGIALRWRPRDR
jgi:hypothetical protein